MPLWMLKHPGQRALRESQAKKVAAICGTQSGKTVSGPWWLLREIARCGPGEYAVGSASYDLMQTKLLPEYERVFVAELGLGRCYRSQPPRIEISEGGMARLGHRRGSASIYFRTLGKPEQWESMTCLAIHSDEAGQLGVPEATFEAQERRLAVARSRGKGQGRHLITSTPYAWNWFKRRVADRADGSKIGAVAFPSWANPAFDKQIAERAKAGGMQPWRWSMMYEGQFTRPAGAVYDCWDAARHLRALPGGIAKDDRVYLGLDFGSANMAAIALVERREQWAGDEEPVLRYYAVATYKGGNRTDASHAAHIQKLAGKGRIQAAIGGSWSEDEWRWRMAEHGLSVERSPYRSVEAGIAAVYALLATGRLFVDPQLSNLIREIEEYQYRTDDEGGLLDKIADKTSFHRLDALRYIGGRLAETNNLRPDGSVPAYALVDQ